MEIEQIKQNFKYMVLDSHTGDSHIFKTDRLVSDFINNTYDLQLSHMYINRNLETNDDFILIEGILIKLLW